MDWQAFPELMGKSILTTWVVLYDIVVFDSACICKEMRHTLFQWFKGLRIHSCCAELIGENLAIAMKWLSARQIMLLNVNITISVRPNYCWYLFQKYLQQFGSALTDFNIAVDDNIPPFDLDEASSLYADLPSSCPNVTDLHLENCINDAGFIALKDLLPKIKTIHLLNCAKATSVGLSVLGQYCHQLTSISFEDTIGVCDGNLLTLASGCRARTSVWLKYCPLITSDGYIAAFPHMKNVTSLSLHKIDGAVFREIAGEGNLPCLESLSIAEAEQITDLDLKHLFSHDSALRCLSLYQCDRISNVGVGYIRNLRSINLYFQPTNNQLTDRIGRLIGKRNPHLLYLSVCHADLLTERFVLEVLNRCLLLRDLSVNNSSDLKPHPTARMNALLSHALKRLYPQLLSVRIIL